VNRLHCTRVLLPVLLAALLTTDRAPTAEAQVASDQSRAYIVFLQARPIGREEVAVIRDADGWIVRGSSRISPPVDTVTRSAEIRYTAEWHPTRLAIEGTSRGQEVIVTTTFADGKADNIISVAGGQTTKSDAVSADTVVLPNAFLGSYAALARRLAGAKPGATFRGYIAPQLEVAIVVSGVFQDRIETPQRAINATRYALGVTQPNGELQVSLWVEGDGSLLRLSVPMQGLELARDDVASASSRTTSFSLPSDEPVRIPANGFNLAGSLAKPAGSAGRLPAVVLVGGSGPTDRDSTVVGVPILGQLAGALVDAGFLVVRYDKRGIGQSGGRAEAASILDYVDDARAVVAWIEKRRDVDKRRIAVVGHSEGAWVALAAASRDKRIAAIALLSAPATSGADVVLEQQTHLFARMKTPEAEQQQKIELQKRINAAVVKKGTWEGIPADLRKTAETPWFESYLSFDPGRYMKDVRQPILIVQGDLDKQVLPHHADKLAELARARKRKVGVDLVTVPGVNHLLLPAKTGDVDEYAELSNEKVSPAVAAAVSLWLAKTLGPPSS
jgi:pimeloyl-ACP methyl ester carboxylesterase